MFNDFSKAFDTVDHTILKLELISIGLSEQSQTELHVYRQKVPLLFIICINDIHRNVHNAKLNFYADDRIMSSSASTPNLTVSQFRLVYFLNLKLILNTEKTHLMFFIFKTNLQKSFVNHHHFCYQHSVSV